MADEKETKKEEFEDLGSKKDPKGGGHVQKTKKWFPRQVPGTGNRIIDQGPSDD